MTEVKKTPLNEIHHKLGGKMIEFFGYEMPVRYTTIVDEHHKVRKDVGLFDLCHMGRIRIQGEESLDFLQYLVTNNLAKMDAGGARYALALNERGTVLDDLIVYNLGEDFLVVCNASNRPKIVAWFEKQAPKFKVTVKDESDEMGMIAIQGVRSEEVVASLLGNKIRELDYYSCQTTKWLDTTVIVARTGYTGEDGFELYLENGKLVQAWDEATRAGQEYNLVPVGLGARDTLRLEAAMPLYGQEITEEINPLEAGLSFAVKLKKGDFIGREALAAAKKEGLKKKLVCMEVEGRRIARTHAKIFHQGQEVGEVTSGTFSPTLEKSIAMGYVPTELSDVGSEMEVQIGKKNYPIKVIKRPFYSRKDG